MNAGIVLLTTVMAYQNPIQIGVVIIAPEGPEAMKSCHVYVAKNMIGESIVVTIVLQLAVLSALILAKYSLSGREMKQQYFVAMEQSSHLRATVTPFTDA